MCNACYKDAHSADMETARVLTFSPADVVGSTAQGAKIFLGPEGSRISESWLAEQGIGRVLTVACESDHLPTYEGVVYQVLEVDDDPDENMMPYLPAAFEFIDGGEEGRNHVLVHCVSGISRSGTVVVAYLMRSKGISFDDALALARQGRPEVHPNSGFWRQLRGYEADLRRLGMITGTITGPDFRAPPLRAPEGAVADAEAAQAVVPPSPKVSPSATLPAAAALGDSSGLSKETEVWTFVAADGSEEVPPPCPECAAPPPAPFLPAPFSELTNSWVVPPEGGSLQEDGTAPVGGDAAGSAP